MGQFLRDQLIKNVTIDEFAITQITEILIQRRDIYNALFLAAVQQNVPAVPAAFSAADPAEKQEANPPAAPQARPAPNPKILLTIYIIRFDNKGYRYFDVTEVLREFRQAENVERLIFCLESIESLRSNRNQGNYLELRLDVSDDNHTHLLASADDRDWCDAAFNSVSELLQKMKNRNAIIRNAWTPALVQLLGVATIFILSVWAASRISPYLEIENPFAISLLFILLVCSNIWGYVNQQILRAINHLYPNIRFARAHKDKMQWLFQAIIGGIAVALVLLIMDQAFDLAGKIIRSLLK